MRTSGTLEADPIESPISVVIEPPASLPRPLSPSLPPNRRERGEQDLQGFYFLASSFPPLPDGGGEAGRGGVGVVRVWRHGTAGFQDMHRICTLGASRNREIPA